MERRLEDRHLLVGMLFLYGLSLITTAISGFIQQIGGVFSDLGYILVLGVFLLGPIFWFRRFGDGDEVGAGLRSPLRVWDVVLGLLMVIFMFFPVFAGYYFLEVHVLGHAFKFSWDNYSRLENSFILLVFMQLFLVAYPEEFFYRGFLQRGFLKLSKGKWGGWYAILIVSVLFAFGHVIIGLQFGRLNVFFPSLLFGLLALKRGSIVPSVIYHAGANLTMEVLWVHFY